MKVYKCQFAPCYQVSPQFGYCVKHSYIEEQFRAERMKRYDAKRKTNPLDKRSRDFYNSLSWLVTRNRLLSAKPLCQRCGNRSMKLADQLHHEIAIKTDDGWKHRHSETVDGKPNLIPLCDRCHLLIELHRAATRDNSNPEQYSEDD